MSFFVSRAAAAQGGSSQDRADVFARGEAAVLVVADGAGGTEDGAKAADVFFDRARSAAIDPDFDLLAPRAWERLFVEVDAGLRGIGETTAVVVVLVPGMLVCTAAGDSEAWIVRSSEVARLTGGVDRARLGGGGARPSSITRSELDGRLVVGTDGLFRHVASARIMEIVRTEPFGRAADALVAAARLPSGNLADDIALLVAERGG